VIEQTGSRANARNSGGVGTSADREIGTLGQVVAVFKRCAARSCPRGRWGWGGAFEARRCKLSARSPRDCSDSWAVAGLSPTARCLHSKSLRILVLDESGNSHVGNMGFLPSHQAIRIVIPKEPTDGCAFGRWKLSVAFSLGGKDLLRTGAFVQAFGLDSKAFRKNCCAWQGF